MEFIIPYEDDQPSWETKACRTLVAAVLSRAVVDYNGSAEVVRDAKIWILDNESEKAMSFNWCCLILDIDPDTTRKWIVDRRAFSNFRARTVSTLKKLPTPLHLALVACSEE